MNLDDWFFGGVFKESQIFENFWRFVLFLLTIDITHALWYILIEMKTACVMVI